MSVLSIPLRAGVPLYDQALRLDGMRVTLRLAFHDRPSTDESAAREGLWRADLLAADGSPLVVGEPVQPGRWLFMGLRSPGAPPGQWWVVPVTPGLHAYTLHSPGIDFALWYVDAAEQAALLTATPPLRVVVP